jgi:hypothetical protein
MKWDDYENEFKSFFFLNIFHRQLIDDVVNGRENRKIAQQKLQLYKTEFVKQYKEELKQLMKQALEEVWIVSLILNNALLQLLILTLNWV